MLGRKEEEAKLSDQISEENPALLRLASKKAVEIHNPLVNTLIQIKNMRLMPFRMLCTTCRMESDAKPEMTNGADNSEATPDG